jgi:cysteinyl-tRNA synthetase
MSKSIGNVILVKDLINQYDGEVIRLALLSSHYRQSFDWNAKIIHQAQVLLDKLYQVLIDLSDTDIKQSNELNDELLNALNDDLNTPGAIAILNKKYREYSSNQISKESFKGLLLFAANILGILNTEPAEWFARKLNDIDENKIVKLIEKRTSAKANKDYALADAIRKELIDMGIEIMDTAEGTSWKIL